MTDTRRTILWVVFTMSLFFLWDAWNKHTGQPGLFGGPRPAASAPGPTVMRELGIDPVTVAARARTLLGRADPEA